MAPADERYAKRRENGIANSFHSVSRRSRVSAVRVSAGAGKRMLHCGAGVRDRRDGDAVDAVT
jgi:hypothetical protein